MGYLFTISSSVSLFALLSVPYNTRAHQYELSEEGTKLGTHQRASRPEAQRP